MDETVDHMLIPQALYKQDSNSKQTSSADSGLYSELSAHSKELKGSYDAYDVLLFL